MKHGIKYLHKFLLILLLYMKEMIMEDDSPIVKLSVNYIKNSGVDWRAIIEFSEQIDLI